MPNDKYNKYGADKGSLTDKAQGAYDSATSMFKGLLSPQKPGGAEAAQKEALSRKKKALEQKGETVGQRIGYPDK